jgi:hypothetical protein
MPNAESHSEQYSFSVKTDRSLFQTPEKTIYYVIFVCLFFLLLFISPDYFFLVFFIKSEIRKTLNIKCYAYFF